MRSLLLVPILLVIPGCCFIGCDEEALFVPSANVTVIDAATGAPIEGGEVTIARGEVAPHFRGPLEHETRPTKADGIARFEHQTGTITQYPLMMHGVADSGWQVCAEAPGYQSSAIEWFDEWRLPDGVDREALMGGAVTLDLTVQLARGSGEPCSELLSRRQDRLSPDASIVCPTDVGCHQPDDAAGPRSDAASADASLVGTDRLTTKVIRFEDAEVSVRIELPPAASIAHVDDTRRTIRISNGVVVELSLDDRAAPTFEERIAAWNAGRNVKKFDEGERRNGLFYAVRAETVRAGIPGRAGAHRLQQVGRVYAILPISAEHHLDCRGFVEHAVSDGDGDLELVRDSCLSMSI